MDYGRREVLLGAAAWVAVPVSAASRADAATAAVRSVIERYADAWARRDPAAFALYHPEFTLHWFGHNSLSGTHSGKEQVVRALTELARRTQRELVRVIATLAGPERGAIIARESFGTGDARVEMDRVLIFTVADDRLRECWVYDSDPDLLDSIVQRQP
jgi:uncharacterized protein